MKLPYRITTTDRRKYRTSHGLTSCRRAFAIDGYDNTGNQHIIRTAKIQKHSAGNLKRPAPEPVQHEPCGYCGHVGPDVPAEITGDYSRCGQCGGM